MTPRLSETPFRVSSSAMSLAPRSDRARRSSFVTTRRSPARHAARASEAGPRSGRARHAVVNMQVWIFYAVP